jgi:hypothetical protein
VVQVVEHMPSKWEAWTSNPTTICLHSYIMLLYIYVTYKTSTSRHRTWETMSALGKLASFANLNEQSGGKHTKPLLRLSKWFCYLWAGSLVRSCLKISTPYHRVSRVDMASWGSLSVSISSSVGPPSLPHWLCILDALI